MAVTPLTRVQQATVLALIEARRLDVVPSDLARSASFLRQARERLDQLPLVTSVVVRYGIAYDACHDTGEALLAAYGFRTTNGPGQHEALGRYLRGRPNAVRRSPRPRAVAVMQRSGYWSAAARCLMRSAYQTASRRDPPIRAREQPHTNRRMAFSVLTPQA